MIPIQQSVVYKWTYGSVMDVWSGVATSLVGYRLAIISLRGGAGELPRQAASAVVGTGVHPL
jgi:hypothetical protein